MKIYFFGILVFLLAFCGGARAEGADAPRDSLFFTPQETRDAEIAAAKNSPMGAGDISLGAVFYYGPGDWTIWLRGEKWTPDTSRDDLRVVAVSANEVTLEWRGEEESREREIVLKPHQTFQIATGKIVTSP